MISKTKWQKYLQKMAAVDAKAAELMRQFIEANGLENRALVISYAYDLTSKYGEVASELACEMYDLMAETQGAVVPPAEPADTATIDEVSRGVMYGKYHSPNQIPSIVGRQVRQAGADTMLKNAIRDQAEWAWIPSGDTCAFCITLASRGWQRASKKVLKGEHAEHIHANCDCTFGIAFNEKGKREYDSIYDPQKYEDMYYGADGSTPKQRINSIRRARYQLNKDYINAQKRDAYQARNINNTGLKYELNIQFFAKQIDQGRINGFRQKLAEGEINTKLRYEKQREHIFGTKAFQRRMSRVSDPADYPTYFYEDIDVAEILKGKLGTGEITFAEGEDLPTEFVVLDRNVGEWYSLGKGEWVKTSSVAIKYSKKGIHAYPCKPKQG